MGTNYGSLMNESRKIDINYLLERHISIFQLERHLRKDVFYTLLVSPKGPLNSKKINISPDTPLIVKVFPNEISNYQKYLTEYKDIKNQYSDLKYSPNVLPILKVEELKGGNATIIMREYIKFNLNDLQYHMNCVSEIEKKWVCLQLLQGLKQIFTKFKCHGDIKPNNILLSSKLSVFYSDISVYKPVYLPIEYLQSYNSFFYSSEHDKSCYLAPERFVNNTNENAGTLTPEMDIFSLGVVMSEIFLEKPGIFTQIDIINYKKKKIDLKKTLYDIKDKKLIPLLQSMIEIEPKKRAKLDKLIEKFSSELCPSPLTKLMNRLNLMIVGYDYYKNDLLIALLYKHFQQIWKCLIINNKNLKDLKIPILKKQLNKHIILSLLKNPNNIYKIGTEFPLPFIPNENKEIFIESEINEDFFVLSTPYDDDSNNDCTLIILKYLLSCLENTKYVSTYFVIFEMIYNLSQILIKNNNSIIILDFIVPYYINLFKSESTRLVIEAYNSLLDLLSIIDYEKLILSQIDYNTFNNYIFDNICNLYFKCQKLEVKCAIITRIDDIIELENNFLYSYLNTINYITNKKDKKKNNNDMNKMLYNSTILYQSLFANNKNNKVNNRQTNEKSEKKKSFNEIYKIYIDDLKDFKKKLKNLIEHIMINIDEEDKASNDCLKLLLIQKYKEICMFCGSYNENTPLFNYLFILFNRDNYYIQKEIIKIFPGLILLYGRKLYFDYFLPFIEIACQKKNSELMIIEIIDAIFLLTKMNLISHDDDYSRVYKILMPYFVHPNYLIRYKLGTLFYYILSDKRNSLSKLYISFYHNTKDILLENTKNKKDNDKKTDTIINIIDKDILAFIRDYYAVPREIFLLYKYNIESNLLNTKYLNAINLLNNITKIKFGHYDNIVKNDDKLQKKLGLVTQKEIFDIKENKLYDVIKKEFKKIINGMGADKEKNSAFVQTNIFNKLIFLFNELNNNKNKNTFIDTWYQLCNNQTNSDYSKILYLLKLLNYKLDQKNIKMQAASDDTFNFNSSIKDFQLIEGSQFKSININVNMASNILNNDEKKGNFCYKLLINESENIIKLIPVNNILGKNYVNMFISISDEGFIRLHRINNEANFDDIYTIKNCSQFQIDCGNYILKRNNISYLEQANKIIVIIAIKKKLQLVTFELNTEEESKSLDEFDISYTVSNIECKSEKEIISVENIYNNNKNYLALGNIDNTLSFYNYIDNTINYINNCISFSASYGNIELILSLSTNNILVSTSIGYIIVYDYNLRLFTYIYKFSVEKKIKQILEYIPQNFNSEIFEQNINKKTENDNNNEKALIYILYENSDIELWNLFILNPINVYKFVESSNVTGKKKSNYNIPSITKLSLEKNEIYDNYIELFKNSFTELVAPNNFEIINMNIPMNYYKDCSIPLMMVGEKSGNAAILRFSDEILNKIKKEKKEDNKFNQLVIVNENCNIKFQSNSKFKKKKIFMHSNYYSIEYKDKKDDKITYEMNDILLIKDLNKNNNYIISCYSNGSVKLYTL